MRINVESVAGDWRRCLTDRLHHKVLVAYNRFSKQFFRGITPAKLALGLGLISSLLFFLWCVFLRLAGAPASAFNMHDSLSYKAAADVHSFNALPPVFRDRLAFLGLLMILNDFSNLHNIIICVALLQLPATVSIFWLGLILSRRLGVAVISALVYALHPLIWFHGPKLGTDVIHAQLAITAVALSVRAKMLRTRGSVVVTLMLWLLVFLVRPTFWPMAVFLPLWWKRVGLIRTYGPTLALGLVLLTVPIFLTAANYRIYRVPVATFSMIENLHRCVVPRMKMFIQHRAKPVQRLSSLWHQLREIEAADDSRYRTLKLFQGGSPATAFPDAYHSLVKQDMSFVMQHKTLFFLTGLEEVVRQITAPPRSPLRLLDLEKSRRYADMHEVAVRKLHRLFLAFVALGATIALARHQGDIVIFLLACGLIVMIPFLLTWWITYDRLRLPLDILLLPLAVTGLCSKHAVLVIGAITFLAYLPARLFGAGTTYFVAVYIGLVGMFCFVAYRVFRSKLENTEPAGVRLAHSSRERDDGVDAR